MILIQNLLQNTVGLLFLIIAAGLILGRIPLGRFRLGGSGVLVAGLIAGHFGYLLNKEIQTIGVVLFVYAVGLRAGPHIVESFKKSKGHFVIFALLIVGSAGSLAWVLKKWFNIPVEFISGIYAGAMTSTPALAAAMETVGDSTPSIGYGLAYPLGVLSVIAMIQLLPLLFKVNFAEEEKKYYEAFQQAKIERRCFKVTNPNITQLSVDEILARSKDHFRIARIQRGDKVFTPHADETLQLGDIALAVGTADAFEDLRILLGDVIEKDIPESSDARSRWLVVSSKQFVGKKMKNLEIMHLYGIVITRVKRSGVEFMPNTHFVFEAGDEVRVSGTPADIERFMQLLERDKQSVHETDIFSFALGLVLGVLAGLVEFPLPGGLKVSLGIAGGPLIVGLLFGYFGRFGRVSGYMPKAAQGIIGDLGLYLFLAVAGCYAGEHFLSILRDQGLLMIVCGFLITLFPVVVTALIGHYLFRMNTLILLGMICGGMTSTPSLGVLTSNTKSDVPALAYTGIYPLAVVFTTLMAQILVLF